MEQSRYLILTPLAIVLVFCFGFVSATGHSHNIANQTHPAGYRQQTGLGQPDHLPALAPANGSQQSTQSSKPATAENNAAAPSVTGSNHQQPTAPAGASSLQAAVPSTSSDAPGLIGQPLMKAPLKTVTDKLSL